MAVTLDATPGSPTANSFATVAEADAYNESQLYGDSWAAITDVAVKQKALITATRLIVEMFARIGWQGYPSSTSQRLPMPRTGMHTVYGWVLSSSVIPLDLVNATSEYARRLVDAGAMPDSPSDSDGIKKLKAGPVEIEFTGGGVSGNVNNIPDGIFQMIAYLALQPYINRMIVPLTRV